MSTPVSKPSSPGVGKRVAVSAIAGVAVAVGGLSAVSWISSSTTSDQLTLPVKGESVTVNVGSGDVQVRAGDVDEVQINRTVHSGLTMPELINTSDGNGILLDAECGWNWMGPCSVDYELVVPADLALNVEASSGDVDVANLTGDVTVSVSSGDVEASGLSGQVDLSTSSGEILAEDVTGDLTAEASSGEIIATGVASDRVRADTSSGDISLTFAGPPTDVEASASSGEVSLLLPPGDAAYDVDTDVGSGESTVEVPTDSTSGNSLRVETGSGDVSIAHSGA